MSEYLVNVMTAQKLSDAIPSKTPEQWTLWLQNNRNLARRSPYRIPYQKMGGAIVYSSEEIDRYIEWKKSGEVGVFNATGRIGETIEALGVVRDTNAEINDLKRQLSIAVEKLTAYDRWLTGGVYFTNEEYAKECAENRERINYLAHKECMARKRISELEAQQSKSIFKQSAIMYFSPILVVYNFIIRLITSDKKGK